MMIPVKFIFGSLLVAAISAQTPASLVPVLIMPGLNTSKCLTASSRTNGALVSILPCTGADSQQWTFETGNVKIFNKTKCLDIVDGVDKNGTKLQIWDCSTNNNPSQRFYYTGDFRLAWTDHGKCVDLTDGSRADGTLPQIWKCTDGNTNQVWYTQWQNVKVSAVSSQYTTASAGN